MKSKPISRSTRRPPTHAEVSALAYAIWLDRGQPEGCDWEHWLEAERQLGVVADPLAEGDRVDPEDSEAGRIDREMERIVRPPAQRSPTSL